mmetsp:Transcript_14596/g.34617  ORF Transcript_14596/g.34617 Transcript_14596/m.34617 type:complete len:214 (+) Transcript_14596:153-794(+)
MLAHLLQYIKQQWAAHVEKPMRNGSSAAFADENEKKAQYTACDRCKSMHLRCDGEKPCGRCASAGCPCVHQPPTKRGPKPRDRTPTPKLSSTACQRCKSMHLKCDGQSPCKRCASVDCECVYQPPTKRGPKPKDGRQSRRDDEKDALIAENLRLARELEELKKKLGGNASGDKCDTDDNSSAGASSEGTMEAEIAPVQACVSRKRARDDSVDE